MKKTNSYTLVFKSGLQIIINEASQGKYIPKVKGLTNFTTQQADAFLSLGAKPDGLNSLCEKLQNILGERIINLF